MNLEKDPKIALSIEVAKLYKLAETSLVDDEYVHLYQDIRRCMILAIENHITVELKYHDMVLCKCGSSNNWIGPYVVYEHYDSKVIATCMAILLCLKEIKNA